MSDVSLPLNPLPACPDTPNCVRVSRDLPLAPDSALSAVRSTLEDMGARSIDERTEGDGFRAVFRVVIFLDDMDVVVHAHVGGQGLHRGERRVENPRDRGRDRSHRGGGGLELQLGEAEVEERKRFIEKMRNQAGPEGFDCEIIDRAEISGRHASIECRQANGRWHVFVKDESSLNGTFINDERIDTQEIHADDAVRFASAEFRLQFLSIDPPRATMQM